jgi:fluoroacetyl-CoA thioesterase
LIKGRGVSAPISTFPIRPRARFKLTAHDGVDEIGSGTHERFIVAWDRFNRGVASKLAKAQAEVDA